LRRERDGAPVNSQVAKQSHARINGVHGLRIMACENIFNEQLCARQKLGQTWLGRKRLSALGVMTGGKGGGGIAGDFKKRRNS